MTDRTNTLPFPDRALVGMVHAGALPGTPASATSVADLASAAAAEARVYRDAGFDGVIVENMHDVPYVHGMQGPEITAAMTRAVLAVREAAPDLAIGIQILSGGNKEALAVARATGARFIRCENFVFAHIADEGILERAEAGPLLRYRRQIGADHVMIFADVKKKHASHAITSDISLAEAAKAAEFFGAGALIVTGTATGRPTSPADVREVREACSLPVLVGSGVTTTDAAALFDAGADALIVGSSVKYEGDWRNPVDAERCIELVRAVRGTRD